MINKSPVEWDDEDIGALQKPNIGNFALALLPALYAWQLYGWLIATGVFLPTLAVLASIGWGVVLGKLKPSRSRWYKGLLIVLVLAALAVSAMEAGRY